MRLRQHRCSGVATRRSGRTTCAQQRFDHSHGSSRGRHKEKRLIAIQGHLCRRRFLFRFVIQVREGVTFLDSIEAQHTDALRSHPHHCFVAPDCHHNAGGCWCPICGTQFSRPGMGADSMGITGKALSPHAVPIAATGLMRCHTVTAETSLAVTIAGEQGSSQKAGCAGSSRPKTPRRWNQGVSYQADGIHALRGLLAVL